MTKNKRVFVKCVYLCFQGCSLWVSAVRQHLSSSQAWRATGRSDLLQCGPAQCFSRLQVHTHTHTYIHTYTLIHTLTHTNTHSHTHTHTHTHTLSLCVCNTYFTALSESQSERESPKALYALRFIDHTSHT